MTSLRHKLWLSFGGLLVILLIVTTLSIIVFTQYTTLKRVFHLHYDSLVYSDAMKQALDEIDTHAQRTIWQESANKENMKAAIDRFDLNLSLQFKSIIAPGEAEATEQLAAYWKEYRKDYDAFTATTAKAENYDKRLAPDCERVKKAAQKIYDINVTNLISIDGQVTRTLVTFRNTLLALVIVGTVLAALVIWTATVAILKPLKDLTDSARQIESGNLDLDLSPRSRDEIGKLAGAFNSMASRLREFKQRDQDRLDRTEQTTQLAIDSLPDAVFVIGEDHTVELSNLAARKLFHIEPSRPIAELGLKWLPALYEEVNRGREPVIPQGYHSAIQIFEDGDERFYLPRAVPMLSGDGRQLGVTIILADVTQLRRVDEAKSDLISTVSHELRTPLTSQRLVLGMLVSSVSKQLTANQQRLLTVAKADGDRLFRTIEDLLSISRIESGRMQFQYRQADIREFLLATLEPLAELFKGKAVDLSVNIPAELPAVKIDVVSMRSAVTNLLSNAMKFTPSGGHVSVVVEPGHESVTIRVADTGPGIPVEYRPRIFEKFYRVPVATGPSGAGLGLSISREIVEAHGGTINFVCPDSGGCTFSITLPAHASVRVGAIA